MAHNNIGNYNSHAEEEFDTSEEVLNVNVEFIKVEPVFSADTSETKCDMTKKCLTSKEVTTSEEDVLNVKVEFIKVEPVFSADTSETSEITKNECLSSKEEVNTSGEDVFILQDEFVKEEPVVSAVDSAITFNLPFEYNLATEADDLSKSTEALDMHRITHTIMPYACDLCKSKFTSKHFLVLHRRTHTGQKPYYTCDICKRVFIAECAFNFHRSVAHREKKQYEADLCEVKLSGEGALIMHRRTHTEEKSNNSNIYDMKCSSKSIKDHATAYSRKRPHGCDKLMPLKTISNHGNREEGPIPHLIKSSVLQEHTTTGPVSLKKNGFALNPKIKANLSLSRCQIKSVNSIEHSQRNNYVAKVNTSKELTVVESEEMKCHKQTYKISKCKPIVTPREDNICFQKFEASGDKIEFLELQHHVDPDSDDEELDEESAGAAPARPPCCLLGTEELPPHLARLLDEMVARDDSALRKAASSNPAILDFDWSDDLDKFVGRQEVFTETSGPTFSVDGSTPFDVFQRIWDADVMDMIVRESNRYGRQLYATTNKLFYDINGSDIWTFLALIMLQSILILPAEQEYWYPHLALLKVGNFHDIMPYKKFMLIKQCLHFVDNNIQRTASSEDRKLLKIWPIIEHLNCKFSSLYRPEQYIVVDESLLLWKGPPSLEQLVATKTARGGIKSYELCDSKTGYLWKMLLYTDKGDKSQPLCETTTEIHNEPEPTSKIVHNLVRPLLNKGHTLVIDNLHNSPLLSRSLKTKKTDTMGTLRLKREYVPEVLHYVTKSNTRQGEVIYSLTEDLTILTWHDSSLAAMISTYHSPVAYAKENGKYQPQVVLDYNKAMGGVYSKNQMLQAYPMESVCKLGWYKKLFRRLLNVSIFNAFVIYNHNKSGSQKMFRAALAKEILEKVHGQKPDPRQEMRRTAHFPSKAVRNGSLCKMCLIKKTSSITAYKCDTCNVNLCIIGCFREYHLME